LARDLHTWQARAFQDHVALPTNPPRRRFDSLRPTFPEMPEARQGSSGGARDGIHGGDLYAALGLTPQAGEAAIRGAFVRLAKQGAGAEGPLPPQPRERAEVTRRFFERIFQAYRVLGDPHRRAAYDARRARLLPRDGAERAAAHGTAPAVPGSDGLQRPSERPRRLSPGPLAGALEPESARSTRSERPEAEARRANGARLRLGMAPTMPSIPPPMRVAQEASSARWGELQATTTALVGDPTTLPAGRSRLGNLAVGQDLTLERAVQAETPATSENPRRKGLGSRARRLAGSLRAPVVDELRQAAPSHAPAAKRRAEALLATLGRGRKRVAPGSLAERCLDAADEALLRGALAEAAHLLELVPLLRSPLDGWQDRHRQLSDRLAQHPAAGRY